MRRNAEKEAGSEGGVGGKTGIYRIMLIKPNTKKANRNVNFIHTVQLS